MKVLSLFDGISCARVAFGECEYYSSEIDKYAIQVSAKNFPNIIRLGDVTKVQPIPDLFLLVGGSPCQDLSIAKKGRQGLQGERSGLFYEYLRILRESKPKYFILENVASMSKESRDAITKEMGVEPIMINAALVSAQSRKRLFWTNIPVKGLPEDRKIFLKDILEPKIELEKSSNKPVKLGYVGKGGSNNQGGQALRMYSPEGKSVTLGSSGAGLIQIGHIGKSNSQGNRVYSPEGKSVTLSANSGGLGPNTGLYKINEIRRLTPIECERLQGLPDNYTEGISNTQRYKCLGNAFNVEVIKFILSFIII
jgi:DNA-cytosine methyltransferase